MSPRIKARLEAFAEGINTFKNSQFLLPIEFYTHGLEGKFEDWTLLDTMKVLKYVHFRMSEPAIESKLLRYDLLMSGLDPRIVDKIAPPPQLSYVNKRPYAKTFLDPVIDEGEKVFQLTLHP